MMKNFKMATGENSNQGPGGLCGMHPQNETHRTPGWCHPAACRGRHWARSQAPHAPWLFLLWTVPTLAHSARPCLRNEPGGLWRCSLAGCPPPGTKRCGASWLWTRLACREYVEETRFLLGGSVFVSRLHSDWCPAMFGAAARSPGSSVTVRVRCGSFESRLIHRWRNLPV